jgi:hypothetical protein
MVLSVLMAIQSAQLVPLPAGALSISGYLDSSFSFAMRTDAQAKWDSTANPHEFVIHFKPSRAIPELTQDRINPFLPRIDVAFHPLASPILCLDEMFKSLPPTLMLMSDGELFFRDFSLSPSYAD